MEWWQAVVSIASVSLVTITAWGLKQIIEIKGFVSSFQEWAKTIDREVAVSREKQSRAEERFGWGAKKIQRLFGLMNVVFYRLKQLENRS